MARTSAVRTQIYLPRRLHRALRAAARARGVSMAQLIREAAARTLGEGAGLEDPLAALIGAVDEGPRDLSREHDHYLYGLPKRAR